MFTDAGIYYVAAELAARGFVVSLTRGSADVLAEHPDCPGVLNVIRVGTCRGGGRKTGRLSGGVVGEETNESLILVSLRNVGARPDFYVIPRDHLIALVQAGDSRLSHSGPDDRPGRANSAHDVVTEMVAGYEERWDLLKRPSREGACHPPG